MGEVKSEHGAGSEKHCGDEHRRLGAVKRVDQVNRAQAKVAWRLQRLKYALHVIVMGKELHLGMISYFRGRESSQVDEPPDQGNRRADKCRG